MTTARTPNPRRGAATVEVRRAGERFHTLTSDTDTWHSFSFGDHYDPDNTGFGALTVHNEDRVRRGGGYAEHRHRDAEIITWVLSGALAHTDSTGRRGTVHRGQVQRLSAGSGVLHTERNDGYAAGAAGAVDPVHFVQMWLRPDTAGGSPEYAQADVALDDLARAWVPVVAGGGRDAAVAVHSRASTLWVTTLRPGESRPLPEAERQHVFVAQGAVVVEETGELHVGDALRVVGGRGGGLTAVSDAELLLWELAS